MMGRNGNGGNRGLNPTLKDKPVGQDSCLVPPQDNAGALSNHHFLIQREFGKLEKFIHHIIRKSCKKQNYPPLPVSAARE